MGDVNAVIAYGFDSYKLDGCGKQENIQIWYDMFNWTLGQIPGAKPVLLGASDPSSSTPLNFNLAIHLLPRQSLPHPPSPRELPQSPAHRLARRKVALWPL
jgi:hypothetical protein